jgi:DNA-directed RNA polymerase subunit beta'
MTSEIIPYLSKFNFNDKRMIELPLRQMMRIEIDDPGDTSFAPGQTVNKFEFYRENVRAIKKGKHPAMGIPVFIGMRL